MSNMSFISCASTWGKSWGWPFMFSQLVWGIPKRFHFFLQEPSLVVHWKEMGHIL